MAEPRIGGSAIAFRCTVVSTTTRSRLRVASGARFCAPPTDFPGSARLERICVALNQEC
jgi:hypothetical protein